MASKKREKDGYRQKSDGFRKEKRGRDLKKEKRGRALKKKKRWPL